LRFDPWDPEQPLIARRPASKLPQPHADYTRVYLAPILAGISNEATRPPLDHHHAFRSKLS
jgi:hypothetical protein